MSAAKDAFFMAEKSAYDMYKAFAEGFREDIKDVSLLHVF